MWNQLVCFLETADPVQLRYVGKEWKALVEYTEQIARSCGSVRLSAMYHDTREGCTDCHSLVSRLRRCAQP